MRLIFIGLLIPLTLFGCFDSPREYNEKDFAGGIRLFCQKQNYDGSALQANAFIVYYQKEKELGNVGQLVYTGDIEQMNRDIGEGFLYETSTTYVDEKHVKMYLSSISGHVADTSLYINRKTLNINFRSKDMVCKTVDDVSLKQIKMDLLHEHESYLEKHESLNKI